MILMQPETDLAAQAVALLREFGAVQVGTPSADFNVDYAVGRLGLGGYGASSRYFEFCICRRRQRWQPCADWFAGAFAARDGCRSVARGAY